MKSRTDTAGFGLVEVLIAVVIGAIGLMAVAGLQFAAATQGRIAEWRTMQAQAAQQVFEGIHQGGYAAAVSGPHAVTVDGNTYTVNVAVSSPALRVKRVVATVPAMGMASAQTFVRRVYEPRPVPVSP